MSPDQTPARAAPGRVAAQAPQQVPLAQDPEYAGSLGGGLLERDAQLERLAALLDATAAGRGSLVSVLGGPGEGKTVLLRRACELAETAGLAVLSACGSHLEREFALGAVRQLLEPPVQALSTQARERLLWGAAALGAGALELGQARQPPSSFAALHGLYWLLAGLAEQGPVLLAIDDAHWLDLASLEWLAYLRARIENLPVLVVVATRQLAGEAERGAETEHSLLGTFVSDARISVLHVEALSAPAVARLAESMLGAAPHASFAAACHRITAGNPLAARELLAELARRGVSPNAEAAAGLGDTAPHGLTRNVQLRLARLAPAAAELACALAVLDGSAMVRQAAALAGLDLEQATAAASALGREGLILEQQPGSLLTLAHPLVTAAVYETLLPRRRARLHTTAATLLRDEHAEAETVAAHLLQADAEGEPRNVETLRAAAATATRRGAPATAATYLRRALLEPPPAAVRAATLAELADAELLLRSPEAGAHLEAAIDLAEDPALRAGLRWRLADALLFQGEWDPALELLEAATADARAAGAEDLALRIDGRLLALRTLDMRGGGADEAERERLLAIGAQSDLAGARPLRLNLALMLALRGAAPERVQQLVLHGLDGGRFLAAESCAAIEAVHAAFALILAERLDEALRFTAGMLADAAARGSVLGSLAGSTFRALAHLRAGALAEAEADLAGTLELAQEQGLHFTIPFTASYLALILQELGRVQEAAALLAQVPLPGPLAGTPAGVTLLEARGRLHLATGELAAAIADLRACGEVCAAMGVTSPNVVGWRAELALALAAQAEATRAPAANGSAAKGSCAGGAAAQGCAEAFALAREQLALAQEACTPRAAGIALRVLGRVAPPGEREAALEQAVLTLEDAGAPLELAHALVDLGAHLRRDGRRAQARVPLKRGLELAHRAGAAPLAQRACEELLASGARPRRPWMSGVQALTASELRVARMAASGASNREIAQHLFVTTQTVKGHLSSVYRKLGIGSRDALADKLSKHD
ncbi:MAG TPA: AAA family ATPase [Solirubrobacteraceae bacterium]|jgi:DNA-binding CsgD family transcriptional regulator